MKDFLSILTILGIFIGSGFVSGREIIVFFTRFGIWSLPCIFLSFFIFWGFFIFLLNFSEKNGKNSKFSCIINIILSVIFTSAMFASLNNLVIFKYRNVSLLLIFIVIFLCYIVFKNGMKMLKKLNFILVPFMIIVIFLFTLSIIKLPQFETTKFSFYPILYSIFYCMLNVSNGSLVIIKLGEVLDKKHKARVAFFSALVLYVLLLITNIVLLENPDSFVYEMPLPILFKGVKYFIINIVLIISSLTSIFSLVYTSSVLMRGQRLNEILIFALSVFLPFIISGLGFRIIITYLYPLASAFGIFMLGEMLINKNHFAVIKLPFKNKN